MVPMIRSQIAWPSPTYDWYWQILRLLTGGGAERADCSEARKEAISILADAVTTPINPKHA